MKQIYFWAMLTVMSLLAVSCEKGEGEEGPTYDLRVLTFEDADYKGSGNYLGQCDWSSLIDNPQYMGALLYPQNSTAENLYRWADENNTLLASEFANNYGDNGFWGGGQALSNYVETQIEGAGYAVQLSVAYHHPQTGFGGHGGSQNFCVYNGFVQQSGLQSPTIYFADGKARIIDHLWVINTTYVLNDVLYGNPNMQQAPFGEQDFLKIIATGYRADGTKATSEFCLFEGRNYRSEWSKWSLASLGEVTKVEFSMEGSRKNDYGLITPAYFAYDDVAVRFPRE